MENVGMVRDELVVRVAVELPESDAALRADGDDVMTVRLPAEAVDGEGLFQAEAGAVPLLLAAVVHVNRTVGEGGCQIDAVRAPRDGRERRSDRSWRRNGRGEHPFTSAASHIPNPLHRRKSIAVALLVDMERNLFRGSVDEVENLSAFLLEFRNLSDFVVLRDIHDSPIQFANTDSVLLRVYR